MKKQFLNWMRRAAALALALLCLPLGAVADDHPSISFLGMDPRYHLPNADILEVHFINVSAADCILLRCGGKTMLVDGGNLETADTVVQYLHSIGVYKLDAVFMTHPHTDHIAGFLAILERMPVGLFAEPALFASSDLPLKLQLNRLIEKEHIPKANIENESVMKFGDATLTFYQWQQSNATINDHSMIIVAKMGNRSVMLAADIENRAQIALGEQYGDALRSDIIKMPHHGLAPLQRELCSAAQPELLIFTNWKSHLESAISLAKKRDQLWEATTSGTVVAVTGGDMWQVWQGGERQMLASSK